MEIVLIVLFVLWFAVCVFVPAYYRRKGAAEEAAHVVDEVPFGPNDILLIECDHRLSAEQLDRLRSQLRVAMTTEGLNLMVLDNGLTAKVLHRTSDTPFNMPEMEPWARG